MGTWETPPYGGMEYSPFQYVIINSLSRARVSLSVCLLVVLRVTRRHPYWFLFITTALGPLSYCQSRGRTRTRT